jgi:tetratricopeptide (TPR) repeat protein
VAAENYSNAAERESDSDYKSQYFLDAARVYVQSENLGSAQQAFRNVLSGDPQNQAAYQELIDLLVREKKAAAVNHLLDEAAQNGVDATPLWAAYARAAESAGDPSTAEQAARVALQNRPSDLETMRLLGSLYFQHGKFAQAAATFEDVTDIDPDSAQDFYMLGISEESDFQYDAADRAFRKAVALRPNDQGFNAHYSEFQARLKQSSAELVNPNHLTSSVGE